MRHTMLALALAGGVVAALESAPARAQPSADRYENAQSPGHGPGGRPAMRRVRSDPIPHPASDINQRSAVPPDLDQRRRDGHMTPEERRLLRQHIEDAVRELYKR
ncbi:hypothetical protein [Paraburkholderia lycopersici]|uniref:Uncharacterized protein n=1 Tax=Paraburkholderia lycopersici TaxID=416944 RepID=A0A1G6HQ79_9BURK|nr:hypothetical protein [Paraburkholderia lycopersici]SDB96351.1 hypothetical protein SAMN05421548_10369 [Paraburkholderia lycopersici]